MDTKLKHYFGSKHVLAMPMTKGEAYQKGACRLQFNDDQERNAFINSEDYNMPGYKVVYQDGYESWSPKETFEEAYSLAETPLDRVNIEISDLMDRTNKLGNFIFNQNDGKDFHELPLGTRAFLLAQFHMMGAYQNLLCLRQSCMEGNEDCRPWGLSFEQILPLIKEGYAVRRNGWNGKGLMVFKQVPAHITSDIIPKMQSLPDEAKRLILEHGDHIDYTCQCLIFNPATGRADSWVPSIADVFANDWELVEK